MTYISSSRTWATTRRTTTTSRKPLRCSSNIMLWKRMPAFASRSKAEAKTRRPTLACSSAEAALISERSLTDIESNYSSIAYEASKQLSTLLRHGDLPTEKEGAIEFWRLKDYLHLNIGLMRYGRANCKVIPQDKKFYLRALLGQDAIPLIQHLGQCFFRTISSSSFDMSYVQSIYIPSQIQDCTGRTIWATDRRYSARLWILWTKNTGIRT